MFHFYKGQDRVRGYTVTRCTNELVAPFIHPRWLASHHKWPHNYDLSLYFCKQLYVKFHLQLDVNCTSFPQHIGHFKGRFSDKP